MNARLDRMGTTRPAAWVTLLGLLLVPLTIAGMFVWGLWKPTDRLDTMTAAVVNLDEPVTVNGQLTPLGRVLAAELIGSPADAERAGGFTWVLTDAEDAAAGLDDGRYASAVTIPKNFSAAATSYAQDLTDVQTATIEVQTSDRGRLLDAALSNTVVNTATSVLNQRLGSAFVGNVFVGMADLGDGISKAASGASGLADGVSKLADGADDLASGTSELGAGANRVSSGARQLASGAQQSAAGGAELSSNIAAYTAAMNQILAGLQAQDPTNPQWPQLIGAGSQLASGAQRSANGQAELANGLSGLSSGADQLASGIPQLTDGATQLADGARSAAGGAGDLAAGLDEAAAQVPATTAQQRDRLGEAAVGTVEARGTSQDLFTAAGLPLFAALALWAGALASFLTLAPMWRRTRTAAKGSGAIAMRSALPAALIGGAQGVLVGAVLPPLLGYDAGQWASFFGLSVLAGVVFSLLVQGLSALLGGFGRFLAFALLVAAFAGGIVSTAPEVLRAIGDASPIGVLSAGMQAIATGASGVGGAVAALVVFGGLGLVLTCSAVARVRRRPIAMPEVL